jgi:hypothetical protein
MRRPGSPTPSTTASPHAAITPHNCRNTETTGLISDKQAHRVARNIEIKAHIASIEALVY